MSQLEKAIRRQMKTVVDEVSSAPAQNEKLELLKKNIGKIVVIPVHEIQLDENVRQEVDEQSLEFRKLVESIREFGILQNAVVEVREDNEGYKLVCVAGHRRVLAAKELMLPKIQCLITQYTQRSGRMGAALAENLNRENLHSIDVAEGYAELVDSGWTDERIANHFEKDRKTIKRFLTIASWPENVKTIIRKNKEKITTRIILELASRSFSDHATLLNAVKQKIIGNELPNSSRRNTLIHKKIENYFSAHKEIDSSTKEIVIDILRQLKIF